jgi:hypothetical protein
MVSGSAILPFAQLVLKPAVCAIVSCESGPVLLIRLLLRNGELGNSHPHRNLQGWALSTLAVAVDKWLTLPASHPYRTDPGPLGVRHSVP